MSPVVTWGLPQWGLGATNPSVSRGRATEGVWGHLPWSGSRGRVTEGVLGLPTYNACRVLVVGVT